MASDQIVDSVEFLVNAYPVELKPFIPSTLPPEARYIFLYKRLRAQTTGALYQAIKRHSLQNSIHKGNVIGYALQDGSLVSLDYIFQNKPSFLRILLEHQDEPMPQFLESLSTLHQRYNKVITSSPPEEVAKVVERMVRDFTRQSCDIEGTACDKKTLHQIIDNAVQENILPEDDRDNEIYGHYLCVRAILEQATTGAHLSSDFILSLHKLLGLALDPQKKGRYRQNGEDVRVLGSSHRFVEGKYVAEEIEKFYTWINSQWDRADTLLLQWRRITCLFISTLLLMEMAGLGGLFPILLC